jgi:ssRNA-specific RNase YbeY (16S rRNA maturation enzyme)
MIEEIGVHIEQDFQGCIGEEWVRKIGREVLKAEGVAPPYEMSLDFTDFETVQKLNRDYSGAPQRPLDCNQFNKVK